MAGALSGPLMVAFALGIRVVECRDVPWELATDAGLLMYAHDDNPQVIEARLWDGLARCMWDRGEPDWTPSVGRALAAQLTRSVAKPA